MVPLAEKTMTRRLGGGVAARTLRGSKVDAASAAPAPKTSRLRMRELMARPPRPERASWLHPRPVAECVGLRDGDEELAHVRARRGERMLERLHRARVV